MRAIIALPMLFIASSAWAQVDLSADLMQIDARAGQEAVRVTVLNEGAQSVAAGASVEVREGSSTGPLLGQALTTASVPAGGRSTVVVDLPSPFDFVQPDGAAKQLHVQVSAAGDTNASNDTNFAYRFTEGLNPPVERVHRVLVVTVRGPSYAGHGPNLAQTVTWAGGEATHVYLNPGVEADVIAALADPTAYDQVWVYDLSSARDTAPTGFSAIADWFNADRSRDIIADGRMIATLWNNYYRSAGRTLADNYYENLRVRGGGLVLGTDHGAGTGPTNGYGIFVDGINSINDMIGIGRFWGNPGGRTAGMQANDSNPVRTFPNNLGTGINSQSSPSNAPTGFQDSTNVAPGVSPIGRTFYTIAWHNGSSGGGAATPAISTTIAGTLGFTATIQAPCRAPALGASNPLTVDISSGAVGGLSYQWSSSRSGDLGTASTLDTSTLPAGRHVISVVVRDQTGFRPGDAVVVDVDGADCNANCQPDAEEPGDVAPANGVLDQCEDADMDGITDPLDVAPCDPDVQSVQYVPARGQRGQMMFEDQWPGTSDADFNDVVLQWNASLQRNQAGQVSRIRLSLDIVALGASIRSGLGLSMNLAPSSVASVTRSIGGETASIALRSTPNTTFHITEEMRNLFSSAAEFINTQPGQPREAPVRIVVDIELTHPVALSEDAPFDLYTFRTGEPGHQIHRPQFSGTAEMDSNLFGQPGDGSAPGRWFVSELGLPFALAFPEPIPYPAERVDIAALYPDILGSATSAGVTHQNYYRSDVRTEHAYDASFPVSGLAPVSEPSFDSSCLP